MIKVAIVGNIASGKSTVEEILTKNGFKVYDTDKIAHNIVENDTKIEKTFGTNDRKALAKIVFSDKNKLKLLESIVHPKVKSELETIFLSSENIVFISVPQLFEAGFENLFDKIIYITADRETRINRLLKRNNYSREEAIVRINAQEEKNKAEISDFIIENNLDLNTLENNVLKIVQSILVG